MKSTLKRAARETYIAAGIVGLLGAGASIGAQGATATVTATAVVLQPIAITNTVAMTFGNVVAGNGVVTLTTLGVRTAAAGTLPTGVTPVVGSFTITGTSGNSFSITTNTSDTNLSDGTPADNMAVTWSYEVDDTASATGANLNPATHTFTSGSAYAYVGAAVTVGAAQPAGTYTGNFVAVINYN